MDITERIKQERGQDTIAGILPGAASASVTEVARSFGLLDSPECYEEINAVEAAKVAGTESALAVGCMPAP